MKRLIIATSVIVLLFVFGKIMWQFPANAQGGLAKDNGDLNGDGKRDITDAIYLLRWMFQGGPDPVAIAQSFQCAEGEPLCAVPGRNLNLPKGTNLVINTTGLGSNTGLELASVDTENRDYTWIFFTADGSDPNVPGNSIALDEYPATGSGHPSSERFLILPSTSTSSVPPVVIDGGGRLLVGNQLTIGNPEPDSNALLNVAGPTHLQGSLSCQVLEIQGGGDIAEPFHIRDHEKAIPGMVVVIDPDQPGKLKISAGAYDKTVAGVISGANGISPGLILKKAGSAADGDFPVALTGRVWCWCDASEEPIRPGDILTSSKTAGHAMKAIDRQQSFGAVLGKAMTGLKTGKGQVLVLVSLQ